MTLLTAKREYEYDVAISYAGEDRKYASELAGLLISKNVRVFYDEYEKDELWGQNLIEKLSSVYSKLSEYCVMFISRHYAEKNWTSQEKEWILERKFLEKREYVLPIKVDDTRLQGIPETLAFFDLNQYDMESITSSLMKKLRKTRGGKETGNPFKGLESFGTGDRQKFFGRDDECASLIDKISQRQKLILFGESGVGKTSLIQAGIMPGIRREKKLVVRPINSWRSSLINSILDSWDLGCKSRLREVEGVIFVDQFEQIFYPDFKEEDRSWFIRSFLTYAWEHYDRIHWVFVIRADYLYQIHFYKEFNKDLISNATGLLRLSRERAISAMNRTFKSVKNLTVEPNLTETLVDHLCEGGDRVMSGPYTPYLQLIGYELFEHACRNSHSHISLSDYRELGEADEVVRRYFRKIISSFAPRQRPLLVQILKRLCPESRRAKLTQDEIESGPWNRSEAVELLDRLKDLRIVAFNEGTVLCFYELVHDILAREIYIILHDGETRQSYLELVHLVENMPKSLSVQLLRTLLMGSITVGFITEPWEYLLEKEGELLHSYRLLLERANPLESVQIIERLGVLGFERGVTSEDLIETGQIRKMLFSGDKPVKESLLKLMSLNGLPREILNKCLKYFENESDEIMLENWIRLFATCPEIPFFDLWQLDSDEDFYRLCRAGLQTYFESLINPDLPWRKDIKKVIEKFEALYDNQIGNTESLPVLALSSRFDRDDFVDLNLKLTDHFLYTDDPEMIKSREEVFSYLHRFAGDRLLKKLLHQLRITRSLEDNNADLFQEYITKGIRSKQDLSEVVLQYSVTESAVVCDILKKAVGNCHLEIIDTVDFIEKMESYWEIEIDSDIRQLIELHSPQWKKRFTAELDHSHAMIPDQQAESEKISSFFKIAPELGKWIIDSASGNPETCSRRLFSAHEWLRTAIHNEITSKLPDLSKQLSRFDPVKDYILWESQLYNLFSELTSMISVCTELDTNMTHLFLLLKKHSKEEPLLHAYTGRLEKSLAQYGSSVDLILTSDRDDFWNCLEDYSLLMITMKKELKQNINQHKTAHKHIMQARDRLLSSWEKAQDTKRVLDFTILQDNNESLLKEIFTYHKDNRIQGAYDRLYPFLFKEFSLSEYADSAIILCEALLKQDRKRALSDWTDIYNSENKSLDIFIEYNLRKYLSAHDIPWGLDDWLKSDEFCCDEKQELLQFCFNTGSRLASGTIHTLISSGNQTLIIEGFKFIEKYIMVDMIADVKLFLNHSNTEIRTEARNTLNRLVLARWAGESREMGSPIKG